MKQERKEGRKEGRKEERKKGRKERRKEGRKKEVKEERSKAGTPASTHALIRPSDRLPAPIQTGEALQGSTTHLRFYFSPPPSVSRAQTPSERSRAPQPICASVRRPAPLEAREASGGARGPAFGIDFGPSCRQSEGSRWILERLGCAWSTHPPAALALLCWESEGSRWIRCSA